MKITNKEIAVFLRLGTLCLIVGAVFSIANGNTLPGIAEFLGAAAGLLAARRFFSQGEADKDQEETTLAVIGSISILISLLGVATALNHILNTGESLLQPICIALFGAAAAWLAFRKRRRSE